MAKPTPDPDSHGEPPAPPTDSPNDLREELRRSEERYRTLFESTEEGFCVLEMMYDEAGDAFDYRVLEANPAFEQYTGLVGIVGATARQIAPGTEPHRLATYARVAAAGRPAQFVHEATTIGRCFDMRAFRIGEAGSRRVGVLITDLTDRARVQAALQENEERLRLAQEVAGIGTWDLDVRTGTVAWSDGVFDLVGLDPEDGVPSDELWRNLLHPDDRARVGREVQAALDAGGSYVNEFRIVRPDGATRWLAARGHVLCDDEGCAVRMLGVNFDVTDRKEAEEALRRERARLETILDTLPTGLVIADAGGCIVRDNDAARDLWGISLQAESWEDYGGFVGWWPETGERIRADEWAMARALHHGTVTRNELIHNQQFVGEERRYYLNNVAPLRDAEGRITGAVAAMQDVTERIRMEQALSDLNETLEARVRERTRQVRALSRALTLAEQQERRRIAHVLHDDLQQLLVGAKMASTLDDADRLEAILGEAIETVRTLSHELSPPFLHNEDLAELLDWLAARKRTLYGLDVTVEISDNVSIPDEDLRVLLYQLLREVLTNVVKHAGTDEVKLAALQAGDRVRVVVEDEGVGFDPAQLDEGEPTFGLPSVRERLEIIGGRLTVESAPGEGTCVSLDVPLDGNGAEAS